VEGGVGDMTWLALRALLRKVPGIWWVALFVVALLGAAAYGIYHHGEVSGETKVHRHALADSIDKEVIVSHLAIEQTDRVRGAAHTAHRFADASRPQREKLRDSVEAMLSSLPTPVVQLIHLDDQQIRRDSVALVAYVELDTTFMQERTLAAQLDTSRQHQASIGIVPPKTHHRLAFAAGVAVAVAGVLLLHAAVR
jgi:hypothetical protein